MGTLSTRITSIKNPARLAELASNTTLHYLTLTAITLLAAAMRFFKLGEWSFWIDEIYEIHDAQQAIGNFSPFTRVSLNLNGVVLNLLGVNEWSARLVAVVVGILTIPVMYFLVKKLYGPMVALISILLLSLSPWHLHWSQNARFYTMLTLFYTLGWFLFYWGMEKDNLPTLALSGLFLGLATYERKMALFIVPIVLVYFLAVRFLPFGRPAGLNRRNLILMAAAAGLVGMYQVYTVIFAGGQAFYSDFLALFIGHQHNPVRVLLAAVSDIGLGAFVFALFGGVYLLQQKDRAGLFLFLSATVPLAVLVVISPFTQTFSRYIFQLLPVWLILAAVGIKELLAFTQRPAKIFALAVLLLLVLEPLSQDVLYYSYQNGNRQDWKGAYALVEQGMAPEDVVVTTRPEIGEYYLGREVTWTQGLSPKDVIASGRKTWFVIDDRTGFISPALQGWLPGKTRLAGVRDVYLAGKPMTMRVYLYDPQIELPLIEPPGSSQ